MPESKGSRRVRISVPQSDKAVLAWLDAQDNLSVSVRQAIKAFIAQHGFGDAFASELPDQVDTTAQVVSKATRRGRKPKRDEASVQPTGQVEAEQTPVTVAQTASQTVSGSDMTVAIARAPSRPRRAAKQRGGGIQLGDDVLGEFGVELAVDEDDGEQPDSMAGNETGSVEDAISDMMAEG